MSKLRDNVQFIEGDLETPAEGDISAYVIDPGWMAWSSVGLPLWLRWTGVGFGVSAGALLIAVFRSLGTNLTDTVVTRARHTLITGGPYRWVRHPFYVAFALAVTADSLVTANWFLALTGAATIGLIVIRTATEERYLIERCGDAYRDYMTTTGRFFPRRVPKARMETSKMTSKGDS